MPLPMIPMDAGHLTNDIVKCVSDAKIHND